MNRPDVSTPPEDSGIIRAIESCRRRCDMDMCVTVLMLWGMEEGAAFRYISDHIINGCGYD